MKFELFWLVMTAILTGLLWIPYILDRIAMRGVMGALKNPGPRDRAHSGWATRLMFAHQNTIENLVVFAVLVLVLNESDYSTSTTEAAAAVFFWSRLAYVVVYTLGIPVLRTLAFLVGFGAQAVLALTILRVI
ncbi:MAG TPA: MAPEG family protein [Xanthobacteraceae bacterium]|jgi:uncharacterized MAPEG superfamily protein|nr:MAPEG family protein [Xanthobacteraceae bacterium]